MALALFPRKKDSPFFILHSPKVFLHVHHHGPLPSSLYRGDCAPLLSGGDGRPQQKVSQQKEQQTWQGIFKTTGAYQMDLGCDLSSLPSSKPSLSHTHDGLVFFLLVLPTTILQKCKDCGSFTTHKLIDCLPPQSSQPVLVAPDVGQCAQNVHEWISFVQVHHPQCHLASVSDAFQLQYFATHDSQQHPFLLGILRHEFHALACFKQPSDKTCNRHWYDFKGHEVKLKAEQWYNGLANTKVDPDQFLDVVTTVAYMDGQGNALLHDAPASQLFSHAMVECCIDDQCSRTQVDLVEEENTTTGVDDPVRHRQRRAQGQQQEPQKLQQQRSKRKRGLSAPSPRRAAAHAPTAPARAI